MARGAIEIPIASDTGAFEKGIRNGVIEPIQDAEKELRKLGDTDAGRDVDRELNKAQTATNDLGDELDDTRKKLDKLSYAAKDVGDGAKKGMHDAKGATADFKDEAKQNFSEVTSSFSGDMSSIGDLAQGTLGGIASSIPGIGLAAGVAAVGIGGITSEIQRAGDRAKEITDGIIADFVEMGSALDSEAVNSRVKDILKVEDTRKQAQLLADLLHITVGQAALAMAGDFEAAGVTVDEVMKGINEAPGTVDSNTWQHLRETIDDTSKALMYGKQAADANADAMDRKASSDLQAAIATGKVTKEVDDLGNELYTLPNGKQILIKADTGKATTDVSSFKSTAESIPQVVKSTVKVDVDTRAWDNWRPQPKSAMVRGQIQAF